MVASYSYDNKNIIFFFSFYIIRINIISKYFIHCEVMIKHENGSDIFTLSRVPINTFLIHRTLLNHIVM